jgi:short-subunit dehydrogenase
VSAAPLAGQTAIITGASRGIGRAIAYELARAGMALCLLGRDEAALQAVAAEVSPVDAQLFPVDLADDDALAAALNKLRQLGRTDVLVHNAALYEMGEVQSVRVETLDALYRVNLRVPFVMTQALLPQLIASKGQIVFINSSLGVSAMPRRSQYSATKHALKGFADSLRGEVNPQGVRVISVYPGKTATEMQAAIHAFDNRDYQPETMLQPADVAQAVAGALALPRTAEMTDLHISPMRR